MECFVRYIWKFIDYIVLDDVGYGVKYGNNQFVRIGILLRINFFIQKLLSFFMLGWGILGWNIFYKILEFVKFLIVFNDYMISFVRFGSQYSLGRIVFLNQRLRIYSGSSGGSGS